jgi:hypothetical protein
VCVCVRVCLCMYVRVYDYFARNMASVLGTCDSFYYTMIHGAAQYYKVCYRIVLEIFSSEIKYINIMNVLYVKQLITSY